MAEYKIDYITTVEIPDEDVQRFEKHAELEGQRSEFLLNKMHSKETSQKERFILQKARNTEYFWENTECKNYLDDVFAGAEDRIKYTENVLFRSNGKETSRRLKDLIDDECRQDILRKIRIDDAFFSMSTYKPVGERRNEKGDKKKGSAEKNNSSDYNRFSIRMWAIEIDYRSNKDYEKMSPQEFYDWMMTQAADIVLPPNYVEYCSTVSLIYILKEPVNCGKAKLKKSEKNINKEDGRKSILKALEYICDSTRKQLEDRLCCRVVVRDKWCRLPGSVDTTDYSIVTVEKTTAGKFSVQDILTCWMPEKSDKPKRPDCGRKYISLKELHWYHVKDYKIIARECPNVPQDELLYLYAVSMAWQDWDNLDNITKIVLDFNKTLIHPLPEHKVVNQFANFKEMMSKNKYTHKNSTIMQKLGLTEDNCIYLGLELHTEKKSIELEKRISECRTVKQRAAKTRILTQTFYDAGFTSKSIAEIIGCTKRNVQLTIHNIKQGRIESGEDAGPLFAVSKYSDNDELNYSMILDAVSASYENAIYDMSRYNLKKEGENEVVLAVTSDIVETALGRDIDNVSDFIDNCLNKMVATIEDTVSAVKETIDDIIIKKSKSKSNCNKKNKKAGETLPDSKNGTFTLRMSINRISLKIRNSMKYDLHDYKVTKFYRKINFLGFRPGVIIT